MTTSPYGIDTIALKPYSVVRDGQAGVIYNTANLLAFYCSSVMLKIRSGRHGKTRIFTADFGQVCITFGPMTTSAQAQNCTILSFYIFYVHQFDEAPSYRRNYAL